MVDTPSPEIAWHLIRIKHLDLRGQVRVLVDGPGEDAAKHIKINGARGEVDRPPRRADIVTGGRIGEIDETVLA